MRSGVRFPARPFLIFARLLHQIQFCFIHVSLCNDESVIGLNGEGKMFKFQINDNVIIDYIINKGNMQVALKIANSAKINFSDILVRRFDSYIQIGNYLLLFKIKIFLEIKLHFRNF